MTEGTLREKIAQEKIERQERYAAFADLFRRANEAGRNAATSVVPPTMIVGNPTTILGNDIDPSQPMYVVPEGPCGFAWVTVGPAGSSFGRWLVKNGLARKSYNGGLMIWISDYGQSMVRKEAHAVAMADFLRSDPILSGVKIYAGSRMD